MKLTIKANIPEQQFMECMLNQGFSGYDVTLIVLFYALSHSWNINKLTYYLRLLESNIFPHPKGWGIYP